MSFLVKSYRRKSKKGLVLVKEHNRKNNRKKAIITSAIAGSLALPVLGYLALKGKARQSVVKTLKIARNKSRTIKFDNIPNTSKSVTFTVEGIKTSLKEPLKDQVEKNVANSFVVNVDSSAYKYSAGFNKRLAFGKKAATVLPDMYINKGHNEVSTNLLANVIALHKQRPDLDINLYGNSAGGISVQQVSEQLDRLNIKHKFVTLGTPNTGFFKHSKNGLKLVSPNDKFVIGIPDKQTLIINDVKKHSAYVKSDEVNNVIKNYFK